MNKNIGVVVVSLFIFQQAWSANLYYIDKEATFSKDEKIESILIHNNPSPSISVHSKNMSCNVLTKTIEEAYKIRGSLTQDSNSWLQCYGVHITPNGPDSVYLETNRYSLGKKFAQNSK